MKKSWIIAPAMLSLLSCHRAQAPVETTLDTMRVEMGERQLPVLQFTDTVRLSGHTYVYSVLRQPVDSLPPAHDDMFGDTRDNTLQLTILRDGEDFYSHLFSKSFFRSSIPDDFASRSILDGIIFQGAEPGQGLTFVLSVSEPDSDQTLPFAVTIAPDGSSSFRQVTIDFIGEDSI